MSETNKNKSVLDFIQKNAIILMITALAVFVSFYKPNFFTWKNLMNLASNTSIRFIIALGVSGCLITRGTDLSAGRIAGFAGCIAATLLQKASATEKFYPDLPEQSIIAVLLLVVAVTGVIGIINGSIISFLKVPPFIATLGMQVFVYGICLIYSKAKPIGSLMSEYTDVTRSTIFNIKDGVPYLLLYAVALGVFMWFLYNKTRHGKYMYAIGGNENAAEVSGVNTSKSKILIYMTAGALYGIAGFLLAAKSGGTSVNMAQGYELEAIAACTIGGVSTNGGVGKISGILVGVLVFEVLKISLQFMGVKTDYTYIVQGVVIVVAVALDLRKYLAKK